jgi:hypothetical protein
MNQFELVNHVARYARSRLALGQAKVIGRTAMYSGMFLGMWAMMSHRKDSKNAAKKGPG